ncbi:SDR family NAD(P)-dependent oxidoreductase [Rhodococcoides fascians]|uniref:SDR family NAD(P)-dependent oxidoreductase n=1 Tax=Rhodococcoides fascians TaxID=1828 RepID=UPI00056B752B|nr:MULTISPECIES: SDR family NAD(P)-dependent oxidoreductase [Rhodococcus]OZF03942.1 short-chain dehydrogenase/reductase [Rhodococcus sp. 15-1189-1-1a]OZF18618.1 short-chain dehydrogenase/reductase [Rhodococcus sp. 14-2686-1-2]
MSRVWIITGSSRGLGRAVAQDALAAGDQVVATARRPEQLDELVRQYGDAVLPLPLDVTDAGAAASVVESAVEKFGRVDVAINNAGYGDVSSVEDVELDDFRRQIDTNFYGVVYMSKAVVPVMRKQGGGHIIQISSIGGRISGPGMTAYQSAKWAVSGFSSGLAQEVAPFGIKVTVLEPGGMRTDWAGSSMTIPPVSEPYEATVGAMARAVRDSGGTEPSDPRKVAELIRTVLDLENPPTRLLVGEDAIDYVGAAEKAQAESDLKWQDLTRSVTFDN